MRHTFIDKHTIDTQTHGHLTVIAALLSMIGPFTIDTYLPSFPDIETAFGIDRAMLTQSLGVYLIAFAISTLFWGPLADRIGRRLVILISLSLYILASAGCALANDAPFFMLMRIAQGLAASGGFIAGRAMIRDAHDADAAHRAMSQVTLLFAVAPAIAPLLGGWLHDHFGWRSVFWFLSGFAALLFVLVVFIEETLADEHRKSIHPKSVIRVYGRTLLHRRFINLALSLSFSFAGLFLYIAGAPTGSNDFGLQFIPMVSGMMLGAYISSRLAHRWPTARTVNTGFSIMAIALFFNLIMATWFEPSVLSVITPLVIYTLGLAMIMPAITILALDCFPHHRGTASSMQGFLQMLINAAVASIAVPLLHTQWQHFVWGQLVFLLLACLFWFRIRYETDSRAEISHD
jgi:DHA1 family bicyclomycin/chloramphenicol resistance-like MFS transporter